MSSTPSSQRNPRQSPLFFCYECGSEMRPLMVPDPHCPNCNGTFVEEIPPENVDPSSADDPRNFQQDLLGGDNDDDGFHFRHDPDGHSPFGGSPFGPPGAGADPIVHLMNMLMSSIPQTQRHGDTTIRFDMGGNRGRVFFTSGSGGPGGPGGLSDIQPGPQGFAGPAPGTHPLEGILSMLSGRLPGAPGSANGGQWGDYALDQQGLDEIITRLMEQNQGGRPVPAPDDMINNLPKFKVTAGNPLMEKECAICKDQFEAGNEVLTLPCNDNIKFRHTFHEDCILPWLKQNGTCPVCRFQLVPQPEHHPPPPPTQGGDLNEEGNRSTDNGPAGFSGFWDMFSRNRTGAPSSNEGGYGDNTNQRSQTRPRSNHRNSGSGQRRRSNDDNPPNGSLPGAWDLD